MFEEKIEQPTEQMIEAKKTVLIRGIAGDVVELLANEVSNEDIERLIGKGFTADFGEGQNIQDKVEEALKDRSSSEIESLAMKINTYKEMLEKKEQ